MEVQHFSEISSAVPTEQTDPWYPLNYDCLLEIFKWLDLKDLINSTIADDTLQDIADWTYKRKFAKYSFDFMEPISVFDHIGPFVRTLTLILDKLDYIESDLRKITNECKVLKSLSLRGFDRGAVKNNVFSVDLENLEVLSLSHCSLTNDEDFFQTFSNLKCLNLNKCKDLHNVALKKCFENNSGIVSFTCDAQHLFYPQLFKLLPNLESLCLHFLSKRLELNSLTTLHRLTNLSLHCYGKNINKLLVGLSEKGILQKLELMDIDVDENTWETLKSFNNLKLLVITVFDLKLNSSIILPPKLEQLKLEGFHMFTHQFKSLFAKHEHLKDIQLADCTFDHHGSFFCDFASISKIVNQMFISDANRQLNIVLMFSNDHLSKKILLANGLRISNIPCDVFNIFYPD